MRGGGEPSHDHVMNDTTKTETFQIPLEAAEAYEAKFVPSIFAEWAEALADVAGIGAGMSVLDVACGTGIVARTALERVGRTGSVLGVDLNPAMLTVAARIEPGIDWREGDADDLPVPDRAHDVVTCQMALMFVPDRARALAEMARVVRPGGTVAVVVPASLDVQPAYRPFVDIAARHVGPQARSLLATYWNCGDLTALVADVERAGLRVSDRRTRTGTARFDSAADFVATEVEGSPLMERIDTRTLQALSDDVAAELAHYDSAEGRFEIPLVGHLVVATRDR